MAKLSRLLVILILLGLVILSGYFFYKNIFYKTKLITINKHKPDVTIFSLHSVSFDKNGHIASTMFTPEMKYNSFNKFSHIKQPNIYIYKTNAAPWHITADSAEIINGNSIYKLIGNVKLHQGASNKSLGMLITTSKLVVYPDKKIAETHKPITFTRLNKDKSHITIHSIGARINQKTGEVKLFNRARGVYNAK